MRKLIIYAAVLGASAAKAQTWTRTMNHLPDTGQEQSFTATSGEDSDVSIFPLSYTVHSDGTLTDEVTGLMWQTADGGEMTIEDAIFYCDTLQLAGHTDWRLPSAHELMSIQDLQESNPSIDTQSFADTDAEYWWSGDAQANDPNKIWVTNAGGGIGNHPKTETISAGGTHRFHVRAVRTLNAAIILTTRFIDHTDGTFTDAMTDLMWQQVVSSDTLTWEEALQAADASSLAGYTDWRLPNIKELHSINQENIINPSIDPAWSAINDARKWWSSTTLLNDPQKAWYLYSRFGITTYDAKTIKHHIRLVRGGDATSSVIENDNSRMYFFPNPVQRFVNYNTPLSSTHGLYNGAGERVCSFSGRGPWSMEALSPGVYVVVNEITGQSSSLVKK